MPPPVGLQFTYTPTTLEHSATTQNNLHSRENLKPCTTIFIPTLDISDSRHHITKSLFFLIKPVMLSKARPICYKINSL
jgi:hypothetical protein